MLKTPSRSFGRHVRSKASRTPARPRSTAGSGGGDSDNESPGTSQPPRMAASRTTTAATGEGAAAETEEEAVTEATDRPGGSDHCHSGLTNGPCPYRRVWSTLV